ncbi:hypothetical protein HY768_02995 [candidate division TA06 bacterium]|uniref:DUF3575 domain-containing protein n=1 Tax=candidate division TA06 bacterium TaxID=2250710 RepID=A0A933MJ08_UNCT6|nr:hypothetical protein [candidate division TA06 bacterium]
MKKAFYFASVVVVLFIFSYSNAAAASDSLSYPSKHGSNYTINLAGPTMGLSLAFGRFVSKNSEIELGLGFVGAYAGYKYHWWMWRNEDNERLSPYSGLYYSRFLTFDTLETIESLIIVK